MLRLLALVVAGLGGEGLGDYQAPSESLAEQVRQAEARQPDYRQPDRAAEVAAFVAAVGGEAG
jgi:hypothetical protein